MPTEAIYGRRGVDINNKELVSKIEAVLELLGKKGEEHPDSAMLQMLTEKYAKAKADVESGQTPVYLLGGSRAYLNAFSDWQNNPLLEAIGAVEKKLRQ